jgi:hypothetical protein
MFQGFLFGVFFGVGLSYLFYQVWALVKVLRPPIFPPPRVVPHEKRYNAGRSLDMCKNCGLSESYWDRSPNCEGLTKVSKEI